MDAKEMSTTIVSASTARRVEVCAAAMTNDQRRPSRTRRRKKGKLVLTTATLLTFVATWFNLWPRDLAASLQRNSYSADHGQAERHQGGSGTVSFTARRRPPKRTNDACRAASLTRPRGVCCHRTGIRYPHVSGKLSTSQFHYIATPMVAGGEVVPEQIAVRWSSLPRLSVSPSLRLS